MKKRPVLSIFLCSASLLFAAEPIRLENDQLSLRFNARNGVLEEIAGRDGGKFTPALQNQYNIQAKDGQWAFPDKGNSFTLKKHYFTSVPNGRELTMELAAPGWKLEVCVRLFAGRSVFSRRLAWTRLADDVFSTGSFRMSLDGLVVGAPSDCTVVHPGHWPPRSTGLTGKPNRQMSALSRNHMPGAVLYNKKRKTGISVTMQTVKSDYEVYTESGNGTASFRTIFNVRANMKKGDRVDSGEELVSVVGGSLHDAFASLPKAWELNGFRLKPRPEWTDGAVLYSAYVQGSAWSRHVDIGNFENFRKGVLPHLRELGVSILWFNPFNQGRYGVYSYDLEPEVGSEADLRALCRDAEAMGIRVLLDLIPHGPSYKKSPYGKGLGEQIVREHPEWISRKADGSFKRWWGGYSMDYANPGWQDEMRKLAGHYITNCGISGWRVDCARYSPDNEQPTGGRIPSQSGTEGAVTMMRRVHEAMDQLKPGCILLGETRTTSHLSQMEFIYDTTLGGEVFPQLAVSRPEDWVPRLKLFLDRDEASMPVEYASGLMRYSENHDTATAIRRYGSGHRDSLLAVCFLIPGLPLVNMDQEQGAGILTAKLSGIRKLPEFIRGRSIYLATGSSDPAVLTFTRLLPERFSAVAINFSGQSKTVELTLPPECRTSPYPPRELVDDAPVQRDGGVLRFELPPYGVRVCAFAPETPSAPVRPSSAGGDDKQSIARKGRTVLENSFWSVEFENGFPVSVRDRAGTTVLSSLWYVSDHFAVRDGKGVDYRKISGLRHTLTRNGTGQSLTFTGKWTTGNEFRAVYSLNGKDLNVELENAPAENAALELCFGTNVEEWFVSALEGALRDKPSAFHPRGDEFTLVEKDFWLRNIRITHLLQKSGVHWQADAQPLDPLTGQIAVRQGARWTGIRLTQEERGLLDDLCLRENGSLMAGTTLRLMPKKGTVRFTLRAEDRPEYPAGVLAGKNWSFRTDGSRHRFTNPGFEMRLNRNEGGGISGLFLPDGTPLLRNSQVYSDDGFFTANYDPEFGKYSPCPGTSLNNKESSMKIASDDETLRLEFGGELKRDARLGTSALPKVAYTVQYRCDGSRRIGFSASVTPQPRPGLGGSLSWEFQIPRGIESVVVQTVDGARTFKTAGQKKNCVIWSSAELPLAKNGTIQFIRNGNIPAWALENLNRKDVKTLSLRCSGKGIPVFRVSFFDGDGCEKLESRGFQCDLVVK